MLVRAYEQVVSQKEKHLEQEVKEDADKLRKLVDSLLPPDVSENVEIVEDPAIGAAGRLDVDGEEWQLIVRAGILHCRAPDRVVSQIQGVRMVLGGNSVQIQPAAALGAAIEAYEKRKERAARRKRKKIQAFLDELDSYTRAGAKAALEQLGEHELRAKVSGIKAKARNLGLSEDERVKAAIEAISNALAERHRKLEEQKKLTEVLRRQMALKARQRERKRLAIERERFRPFRYYAVVYPLRYDPVVPDTLFSLRDSPDDDGYWTLVDGSKVKIPNVLWVAMVEVRDPAEMPSWCPREDTEYGPIKVAPKDAELIEMSKPVEIEPGEPVPPLPHETELPIGDVIEQEARDSVSEELRKEKAGAAPEVIHLAPGEDVQEGPPERGGPEEGEPEPPAEMGPEPEPEPEPEPAPDAEQEAKPLREAKPKKKRRLRRKKKEIVMS